MYGTHGKLNNRSIINDHTVNNMPKNVALNRWKSTAKTKWLRQWSRHLVDEYIVLFYRTNVVNLLTFLTIACILTIISVYVIVKLSNSYSFYSRLRNISFDLYFFLPPASSLFREVFLTNPRTSFFPFRSWFLFKNYSNGSWIILLKYVLC